MYYSVSFTFVSSMLFFLTFNISLLHITIKNDTPICIAKANLCLQALTIMRELLLCELLFESAVNVFNMVENSLPNSSRIKILALWAQTEHL